MVALPFRPTPFFRDKSRAFWNLQFVGWTGALLLRTGGALAGGQDYEFFVVLLIEAITGFSISLILAVVFKTLLDQKPIVTWVASGAVLLLAVSLFAFVMAWVIGLYRTETETAFLQLFIGYYIFPLTLLGAWSALYYAINFFLQIEEQADQLARLELQATSAQLAMLRYQLNPHFLFNTLNSISTLILLKETAPANAMVTKLSSFLRHTLVNKPSGTVTLAEEIETLKLYLGIERMRFAERLRTEFDIAPEVEKACLPSLLLQPLVENAIKYAVSPQEEGAEIKVRARQLGNRLQISVIDTGPGIDPGRDPASLPGSTGEDDRSTGVGLANIRDRLQQAYGEEQRFDIVAPPGGGFTVTLELPYEIAEEADKAAGQAGRATKPAIAAPSSPAERPLTPPQLGQAT